MRNAIVMIAALFLGVSSAAAQSRSFECGAGKPLAAARAKAVIEKVQAQYGTVEGLRARFLQESYLASLDLSETSEGMMSFRKPGEMRWDYTAPEKQTFLIKDHVVYLYQPADSQLVIDKFDDVLISDLPVAFLMGIGNLAKDFTLVSACENADGVVLELRPAKRSDHDVELRELKLLVSPGSAMPVGGKVLDVSGNVTAIVLKAVERNPPFDAATFSTDFPPGIDVTDRRREREQ